MDWSLAAGLLLQEMDARKARKAAGAEMPAEITADGVCHGIERDYPNLHTRGVGPERPSATNADSFRVEFTMLDSNARWETGMRQPPALGWESKSPRPLSQPLRLAANDDSPVHAGTSITVMPAL